MIGLLIVVAIVVVLGYMLVGTYNRLVGLRQNANQAFAAPDMAARKEAWAEAYRRTPHGRPVELPTR